MTTTPAAIPLPPPAPTGPTEAVAAPRSWLGDALLRTVGRNTARLGLVWITLVAVSAVVAPWVANSYPYLVKMDGKWSSPLLAHLTGPDVALSALAVAALAILPLRRPAFHQKVAFLLTALLVLLPLVYWRPLVDGAMDLRRAWPSADSHLGAIVGLIVAGAAIVAAFALAAWMLVAVQVSMTAKLAFAGPLVLFAIVLVVWPVNPSQRRVYSEYREAAAEGRVQWVLNAPIPYSPSDRLRDQFDAARPHPWAPDRQHLLGTDLNGSDILSNMMHACRIAMSVGFISTGIALMIGILIGGLMGYFVGWVDLFGMRLVEIFGAIPTIYLLLTFVAYYDRNIYLIMVIIGLTAWVGDARFVRAEFLKLRNQDFVHAAIAAGLPLRSVLFRHLLPNALAPLLVSASFGVAGAITAESTLSFLGLGLVDEPSWGRLLDMARGAGGSFHWWLALFPGLAIFLTVLSYNLVGEALRDALDPKLRKSE